MATLTNIAINARSMNGLITISDGAGTIIENGTVDTDSLITDTMTSTNMISTNMIVPRVNTALVPSLGANINLTTLTQNMNFDTVTRQFQIWNDTAASQLMTIDVDNNAIQFNSYLPTSTQTPTTPTQLITKTYADSTFQPVGSYATLGGSNAFTGTNTFNTNLPTSTQTPSTGTQLITKTYADSTYQPAGSYATLNGNNDFTGQCTFNAALPTSFLSATTDGNFVTRGYGNSIYPRLSGATNEFTSTNTFNASLPTSTITTLTGPTQFITRQLGDGRYQPTGSYATLGGSNAFTGTNTFNTNLPTSTLTPTSYDQFITQYAGDLRYQQLANVAIYIENDANDNSVLLGSGPTTPISGYDNFTAGIQAGESLTSGYANTAISKYALSFCTTGYDNVACGVGSMFISDNGNGNSCFGNYSGQSITNGYENVMLGLGASVSNGSIHNAVAIGAGAIAEADYEFVLGWDNNIITIPNKVKISSCQFTGTPTTFTINWRTNEYVVVNSATCNQINLPQAIDPTTIHIGACFHICRTHLSTSNLVISAFGTEKINWKGTLHTSVPIDSWVMSISFVCVNNVAGNGVWSVFTYNYRAELATDANKIQTLADSTNVNYPVCFTTASTGGNYNGVLCDSSLNYNPSTSLLTVPNLIVNNIYKANATAFIGSNDTVLPGLPTLYGFYFWTDANPSGVADTVITLPQLTTDMDGCKLTFRRIAYQNNPPFVPRQLVIKTPLGLFNGLNQLIVARDSATTILANTNYVLLTTAVSRLGAFASLVVRQNAWYVID